MVWIAIICGITTFAVLLAVFSHLYFGSKRLAAEEEGLKPIYQEQCGGRFDSWNYTIPFVRFTIYEDFIVVACGSGKHVLPFEDVEEVFTKMHLFSEGIHIKHSRRDIPSLIVWSLHPDRAMAILREKGVAAKPD